MNPTVTLTLVEGQSSPGEYTFDERTTCILGRADDCVPRLPDDARHRTVSRHHCLLDINPPDVRIRDFGSLNGTFVNGAKIGQRQAGQRPDEADHDSFAEHDLYDGDLIRLGDTTFRVDVPPSGRTLILVRCAKCDREIDGGAADAEQLCAGCQSEPAAVLRLLLDLAADGRADLAPIAGYRLIEELGRGGMGSVHLARNESTGESVALKLMLPKVAGSAQSRGRFLREVAVTRALRHRNIAGLHDAGFAGGGFYFTMEYCAGGSLDRYLDRAGTLPADEAVRLIVQVLDGLGYAHDQGVVHRDLSPGNILLTRAPGGVRGGDPVAKVADFGLAKSFDQAGLSGLTRTGATAGKPWYMSRQQVVNFRAASPTVDVWAAAACLYVALTGVHPRDFPPGRDPWQVVLDTPAVPILDRDPSLPRALADAVDTALRERPAPGFTTAAEFRQALRDG